MLYALRKLIAFVFLGGIFWFIYQDLDNLDKPWFLHALGMIAVAFAFFWLLIPMVVVWFRIRSRQRQNMARYEKWLADGGTASVKPMPAKGGRAAALSSVGEGSAIYLHEKGTLYAALGSGLDAVGSKGRKSRPGRPSDVAFPHLRRKCSVHQRTHCYITDRGVAFAGKHLDFILPFGEMKSFSVEPGGLVFEPGRGSPGASLAFTFQNPLVVADILRYARSRHD